MNQYFFIDQSNQQSGPIDPTQFAQYGVTGSTMVWAQGMANWMRADQIPELIPYLTSSNEVQSPQVSSNPAPARHGVSLIGKPSNNLWLAVASTIFCCQILGIIAIHYAAKVDTYWLAGEYDAAHSASKKAIWWSVAIIIIGLVMWTLFMGTYAALIAAALKNGSSF